MVVATRSGEIEFGMLDQDDYTGINEYVQKHGLQDASMAAARQAKKLNVNPPAQGGKKTNGTVVADEGGLSELQRAEQELQDLEDEDEEDYDPGQEGESEGSGEDSDEDSEGEDYDEEDDDDQEMEG